MSEKRSTDVTEPTPNVDSPLKKKVKTDDDIVDTTIADVDVDTNGTEPAAALVASAADDIEDVEVDTMVVEGKDTNGTSTETKTESTDDAAAKWTPPPFGSICWIQIPATDVGRSKAFYTSAFSFSFKPTPAGYNEEDIAMFTFSNPGSSLTGGICKVDENSKPSGSTILYFMVDDVDKALEKIVELGGKVREEKKPEGEHGLVGLFEDTEGNVHGVYQMKPAAPAADEATE
ncbi:hypothetical protein TWF506_008700 [Arthrobotrys conoides]|uniref:VOC domain-containing protein n=1 Tax=Arthrobotrys conoides TaxID=74498 RepID=A0AAN8NQ79_9PEZI